MSVVLLVVSRLCIVWVVGYAMFSFRSALWAGARHGRRILLLEFQSHRARGSKEVARSRLLRRLAWAAAFALLLSVVTFIAGIALG